MKYSTTLYLLLLFSVSAVSQNHLPGLWKGMITKGGINSKKGQKFELYLEVTGNKIKGRTFEYDEAGKVVEMQVEGYLFSDYSITLHEVEFIPQPIPEILPNFNRKYQLVFKRSIWASETSLNGYWQEIIETPLAPKRKRGRIFLEKVVTPSKA